MNKSPKRFEVSVKVLESRLEEQSALTAILAGAAALTSMSAQAAVPVTQDLSCTIAEW